MVHSRVLKELKYETAGLLVKIGNLLLKTVTVPEEWTVASTVAKQGSGGALGNYTIESLTAVSGTLVWITLHPPTARF